MKTFFSLSALSSALMLFVFTSMSAGCAPKVSQNMDFDRIMPQELADCKVFELSTQSGRNIYVVRCGDSVSTQYNSGGKSSTSVHSATINDRYPPR